MICMLKHFQAPRGQKITTSQTPRQPYRGLHPTHQAQDSDTLLRSHNRHTTYGSNEESPPNRWVPSRAGTAGNEKADEWAKMAARNERGSEQLALRVQ